MVAQNPHLGPQKETRQHPIQQKVILWEKRGWDGSTNQGQGVTGHSEVMRKRFGDKEVAEGMSANEGSHRS